MYLASTNFSDFSVSYETVANACTQICLLKLLNLAVLWSVTKTKIEAKVDDKVNEKGQHQHIHIRTLCTHACTY